MKLNPGRAGKDERMAQKVPLTLENLGQLDNGKLVKAFEIEVGRIVADCLDRPTEKRPRKLAITFSFAPEIDVEHGKIHGDTAFVGAEITATFPNRRSKVYTMQTNERGELHFHPEAESEPDANLLYDDDTVAREQENK